MSTGAVPAAGSAEIEQPNGSGAGFEESSSQPAKKSTVTAPVTSINGHAQEGITRMASSKPQQVAVHSSRP